MKTYIKIRKKNKISINMYIEPKMYAIKFLNLQIKKWATTALQKIPQEQLFLLHKTFNVHTYINTNENLNMQKQPNEPQQK